MGEFKQNQLIHWLRFTMAIIVGMLDSAFTQGYHMTCDGAMKQSIQTWLIQLGFTKNNNNYNASDPASSISPKITMQAFSYVSGSYTLAGAIGSLFIIWFANIFGRKGGMIMSAFISIFASIFAGYSKYFHSYTFLLIGQILFGIKQGLNSGLGPMYFFEISPQEIRGIVGVVYGLIVSFGCVIGKRCGNLFGNEMYWPLGLSIPVIPAIIQLIFLPLCPESPHFLFVIKKNENDCRKALKWLRGSSFREKEVDQLRKDYQQRRMLGQINFALILNNPILRQALVTSTILTCSQQLCGVTVLRKYVEKYIALGGLHFHIPNLISATLLLFVVEKMSRKILFLGGFITMAITSIILWILIEMSHLSTSVNQGITYFVEIIYLIAYKSGCGTLSWHTPSEYFNTSAAPIGYTVGAGATWFLRFAIVTYVAPFSRRLRGYSLLNFTVTNFAMAYFTYYNAPETRRKTIKEVYREIYSIIRKKL